MIAISKPPATWTGRGSIPISARAFDNPIVDMATKKRVIAISGKSRMNSRFFGLIDASNLYTFTGKPKLPVSAGGLGGSSREVALVIMNPPAAAPLDEVKEGFLEAVLGTRVPIFAQSVSNEQSWLPVAGRLLYHMRQPCR